MSPLLLTTLIAIPAGAALLARVAVRSARQAARSRQRARAWAVFVERSRRPPPGTEGHRHPLVQPEGEVVVSEYGLVLSLREPQDCPIWVPWVMVHHLDTGDASGVRVYLPGGLHVTVSALAGRDIWNRQRAYMRASVPAAIA